MKRLVRSTFSVLLLIVVAANFGWRVTIRSGSGSFDGRNHLSGSGSVEGSSKAVDSPLDFPLFNSTLLKLAETEAGEPELRKEIKQLMEGEVGNPTWLRTFSMWLSHSNSIDVRIRISRGMPASLWSPAFNRVLLEFRRVLGDWGRKKRFQPDIMDELVDLVKAPIDRYNGVEPKRRKYSSCAVVGSSGILLSKNFGRLIDSHEAVIRLKNAPVESYEKNVGSKTSISFVNSNILHLCAVARKDCYCHPYGANVPIVMYMCQPIQFVDYIMCNLSHKSPLIVTDPRFDVLSARVVKYYSLKRFADGPNKNKTLNQWYTAHEDSSFHYSSGMQAVMLALGICDQVSLFGFGKSTTAKHHYHTNRTAELVMHDFLAEYDFYRDLVERPRAIPFISSKFKFPPVAIHQ